MPHPTLVRLDLRRSMLLRDEQPVALRPKTWSVLLYLAERPGLLVSRDELLGALWPGVAVTPDTVGKSISELRAALGDDGKPARFIETANRRGYRFLVDLLSDPAREVQPADTATSSSSVVHTAGGRKLPIRPLVGRENDLAILTTGLTRAQAGHQQIVMVSGPAGIGKTALVDGFLDSPEVREHASRVRIARAGCFEHHGPVEPLLPVLEALENLARQSSDRERLVRLMRRTAPMWLAQMPWLMEHAEAEELRRSLYGISARRMPREFAALIDELTADHALLLVLEDLHWSDPATVDVITLLAQRRAPLRLLMICTYRPADVAVREHTLASAVRTMLAHQQCVHVPLHDLTEAAVRTYLAARFPGNDFPGALPTFLHAHTGGHPLFLVAAANHMVSRGWILETRPGWGLSADLESIDLGVPEDVRQLIETQLHQQSPAERAVLEAASVAGSEITTRILAAALDLEVTSVERHCEMLARAALFLQVAGTVEWPDGNVARRYAFTHELHRQVVYEAIPEERRQRLHQRIGEALEVAHGASASEIAALLAVHFQRGRDLVRAQRYLTAAGRRARQRFSTREAIAYFQAALTTTSLLPDVAGRDRLELEVRLELGRALADGDGFAADSVRANYARVSELCLTTGDASDLFAALYARWYLHSLRAQRSETIALTAELADLAGRLGTAEHAVLADSARVRVALWDGQFADAKQPMEALLAREGERSDAAVAACYGMDPVIAASMHHASVLWMLGEVGDAQAAASAGLARARGSANPFFLSGALAQAAMVELFRRNSAAGADLAGQAVRVTAEHGFAFWHAYATALQGWALVQQEQASDGARTLEHAVGAMEATVTQLFLPCVHAFLAEACLRSGAYTEGLAAVSAGLALAETTFGCGYEPELWRLRGELMLAADASAGAPAERCLLRALELSRASQARSLELRAATSLARIGQQCDRLGEAGEILADICSWFAGRPETHDLVAARILLRELSARRGTARPSDVCPCG